MQIPSTGGLSLEMKLVLWIFSASPLLFSNLCQCDQLSRSGLKWWTERMEWFLIRVGPFLSLTIRPKWAVILTHIQQPSTTFHLLIHNIHLNTGLSGTPGFINFLSITAQCSRGAPQQKSEAVAACFCRKTLRSGGVCVYVCVCTLYEYGTNLPSRQNKYWHFMLLQYGRTNDHKCHGNSNKAFN